MNSNSRDIVPLNGSARTTDPPPDPGRESADRNASGRAASASEPHLHRRTLQAGASFPPPDYAPPRALCEPGGLRLVRGPPAGGERRGPRELPRRGGRPVPGHGLRRRAHPRLDLPEHPPHPDQGPRPAGGRHRRSPAGPGRSRTGTSRGTAVPTKHLKTLLASEAFLQQFPPVDIVEPRSRYLPDFILTRPGYNDGGYGQRILHIGEEPWIELTHDYIDRFLDVMAFATEADRTNAVAAALTVMLRNFWPGGKPCLIVTSTKSHGGKETIVVFASGTTPSTSISYEKADWALQKAFVAAVKHDPDLGLIDVENARLQRGQKEIALGLPGAVPHRPPTPAVQLRDRPAGPPPQRDRRRDHDQLRHRLGGPDEPGPADPPGPRRRRRRPRLADRQPQAGVPPPQSRPDRGRAAGHDRATGRREHCPLDTRVRHPFSRWAQTVGGILMVNGFSGFLGNYSMRKTADDPVRQGLGLLGVARPGEWLRSAEWARLATNLGLVNAVIPEADRDSDLGRERGMGVVLSAHRDETFHVETEDRAHGPPPGEGAPPVRGGRGPLDPLSLRRPEGGGHPRRHAAGLRPTARRRATRPPRLDAPGTGRRFA